MAHWAELDENNIVLRVTVGNNDDENGDEGYAWLVENLGGRWVKTSYNTSFGKRRGPDGQLTDEPGFRGHFAGEGFYYDEELDAFIPPKPTKKPVDDDGVEITDEGDWVLNTEKYFWEFVVKQSGE